MSNQRSQAAGEPLRPAKKKKRKRRWLGYTLLVMLGMMLGIAAIAGNFVYKAYKALPAIENFDVSLTSFVYDSKGQVVYKLAAEENRTLIKDIKEIPEEVLWAFVDTEDHRFYEHHGVDPYRLVGAVWNTAKYYLGVQGSQMEGASTITMQLAGNAFLDRSDITPMRKVQEMLLALQLTKQFTKEEVLLKYLNQVSFGYQAAGLEEASRTYFNKPAKELTVEEAAVFAGMLKGPSQYNPVTNPDGAKMRRNIVLDLMVQHGHLDGARAEALKQTEIKLNRATITPTTVTFTGDWYVDYVIEVLTNPTVSAKYGTPLFDEQDLFSKGLKIYTALDLDMQKIAQEKLQTLVPDAAINEYKTDAVPEAATVIMDHRDGHVKALVGGLNHENMRGYNRATQAYRQPGSSMKPIVAYLPAIDLLGWGPSTVIDDSPPMLTMDQKNVWPENYEFKYSGLVPMRHALEQSINAVAVRTLQAVTPRKGIEYARLMGLSTIVDASMNPAANDENLSLALGGITTGVTPLEMTAAYGVLGSLGMKTDPVIITKIENKDGAVIFEAAPRVKQVIKKESVWLMVDVMKGAVKRGTPSTELKGFNRPAGGKTGTTENWHDAWFVGYTPELVTAVWTGYDNNNGEQKRLPSLGWKSWTGAGPPSRIWKAIMTDVTKDMPVTDWQRPPGLVAVEVCKQTGMLPSPLCPPDQIVSDWYRKGFEPKQLDNVLTMAKVVQLPWMVGKDKKVVNKYYLWQEGCPGVPEDLVLINRPTKYVKHPTDPYNFTKYWPADWWKELPTESCAAWQPPPGVEVPGTPKPDPGTQQPGTDPSTALPGTLPGNGTQPGTGTQPGNGGITLPPILPPVTKPGN